MADEDEFAAIGRELGMFLRRWLRVQGKRGLHDARDLPGEGLDRAAFMLLGRIAMEGPARLSTLATELCVDLSVASRQVAALEAAGLVARTPDPGDRRASVIEVTAVGTDLFRRKRERFLALLRTLLADWSPAERAEFVRLMGSFNRALAAHEEEK